MEDTQSFKTIPSQPVKLPSKAAPFVQIIWLSIVVLSVVFFVMGWPFRLNELTHPPAGISLGLEKAGLTPTVWAIGMLGSETLLMLFCTLVGIFLYFQLRKDLVIFLTSLALITFSTGILNVLEAFMVAYPQFDEVIRFQKALAWVLVVLIFYIFPDGRFELKWTRGAFVGWLVFTLSWLILPDMPHDPTRLGALSTEWVYISYLGWLGSGAIVLFWRSIHSSSLEGRQKTKWVTTGLVAAVFIAFMQEFPTLVNNNFVDHTLPEGIWYALISTLIFCLGVMLVPLGIIFSIQHHRLWQIDFLINRALVYGLMVLMVVLGMYGIFTLFTDLVTGITGVQYKWFPFLISGLLVFYLFRPTFRWVQSLVDKHVFGIHISYQGTREVSQTQVKEITWTGQTVGRYQIKELIRTGRSGRVYQGEEIHTGKPVAVKFLHQNLVRQTDQRKAFVAEAKTLSKLNHPNIGKMLDYGEEGQSACYIVMEYLSTQTLADKLREEGPFSMDETKYVLDQIASALEFAHQQEIIHLDVKPGNILLKKKSGAAFGYIPILTDFGISRTLFEDGSQVHRGVSGTLDYISPEQIHSPAHLDRKADIYSLGVVAYQLVTGELPFQNRYAAAKLIAHLFEPPPNPLEVNPAIPSKAALAIQQAMRKNPIERYNNVLGFTSAFSD